MIYLMSGIIADVDIIAKSKLAFGGRYVPSTRSAPFLNLTSYFTGYFGAWLAEFQQFDCTLEFVFYKACNSFDVMSTKTSYQPSSFVLRRFFPESMFINYNEVWFSCLGGALSVFPSPASTTCDKMFQS